MTRREFTGGALCLLAGGWRVLTAAEMDFGTPDLKIGVLSDLHFAVPELHPRDSGEECMKLTPGVFRQALEWFRDERVDGVVIAGDLTELGLMRQLEHVARAWYEVFPDNRRPDGGLVEKLFVYGNHDIDGGGWAKTKELYPGERTIAEDPADAWERFFDEKYQPFWHKRVKGYSFLGAHWNPLGGVGSAKPGDRSRKTPLRLFLDRELPSTDPSKPFFYIQHPHLRNTCYGADALGCDSGVVTEALYDYPRAVAVSGHSHASLTDERSVWQGGFTAVGAGALHMLMTPDGRANSTCAAATSQMAPVEAPLRQALLLTLHGNTLVINRRELMTKKRLGPDWVVPIGGNRYDFEKAAAKSPRPEFPAGAQIAFTGPFDGADRAGKACRQCRFAWPAARCDEEVSRAFDYEVTVETGAKRLVRRVFSKDFWRPPEFDRDEVTCVFAADELGAEAPRRVSVTALNSYGVRSDPLVREDFRP